MSDMSLPNNIEAEQAVLGAILLDSSVIKKVIEIISSTDFYKDAHSKIFNAMIDLNRNDKPIDLLTIYDYLKCKDNLLEEIGESCYLTYLTELVPTTENVTYYAELVKKVSRERLICDVCTKIDHDIRNGNANIYDAVQSLITITDDISKFDIPDINSEIVCLSEHKPEKMSWLIEKVIPKTYPTMIYAEGGIGKSLLALYISISASIGGQRFLGHEFCEQPQNVLYVDYELDINEITLRAKQLARGLGLSEIPNNLHYWRPRKNLNSSLVSISHKIKAMNIGLLVIDSIGASGVDAENVLEIVNLFSEFSKLGISTLILDHQSKQQSKESYRQKTPYGSVYKYNLSRSIFQLSCTSRKDNTISLLLNHTKSNFGYLVQDITFHIRFEDEEILIKKFRSDQSDEVLMEQISIAIKDLSDIGENPNQKKIIEHFKGSIARDKLISLLDKGESELWKSKRGERKEKVYVPIILNPDTIYTQDFRVLDCI